MKRARFHMDLFKVFADLADTRSFTKTAAMNYITQSAVSQQVAFLEESFGKKLIDRGKGRFSLTEEGEILRAGSHRILDDYNELTDRIHHQKKELSGTVKVETVYSIGLHELAPYMRTFMQKYPQVNLHVEYLRSDKIYSDVLSGKCDLGILAYPHGHPLVHVIPFKKEKLVVVCSPDHPWAKKKTAALPDLDFQKFIGFEPDIPTRRSIDGILAKAKVHVNIIHEFDNIETLKRTVEVGTGISILPENTIAQEVKNKTIVKIELEGGPFYRPTGIIYRDKKPLSRATQAFMDWLSVKNPLSASPRQSQ